MENQACEDTKSDKPGQVRRRLALRLLVAIVAISALGAAYWFTRPPELVWWKSPAIGKSKRHVRVLIPRGWNLIPPDDYFGDTKSNPLLNYNLVPSDDRPKLLGMILPYDDEEAIEMVSIQLESPEHVRGWSHLTNGILRSHDGLVKEGATKYVISRDETVIANVNYYRNNRPAFNRTYRQICNSLTIE